MSSTRRRPLYGPTLLLLYNFKLSKPSFEALTTSPPGPRSPPGMPHRCLGGPADHGNPQPGPHLLPSEGGSFWSLPHALSLHCPIQLCLLHRERILYSFFNVLCTNPFPDPPSPSRPCTSLPLLFHHLALIDFPQPGSPAAASSRCC